jgi:hypothetical protein
MYIKSDVASNKKEKVKKICRFCNTLYFLNEIKSQQKWEKNKFCSIKCQTNARMRKKAKAGLNENESTAEDRGTITKSDLPKTMSGNSYPSVERGHYDINGTTYYFRSKWEANYALYLDWLVSKKQILEWQYEQDTFVFEEIKFGTRQYTPDFKIFNKNKTIEYHEVKGYMDSKSKTKLKRMKKYFPSVKLVLIDADDYRIISKEVRQLCKFY